MPSAALELEEGERTVAKPFLEVSTRFLCCPDFVCTARAVRVIIITLVAAVIILFVVILIMKEKISRGVFADNTPLLVIGGSPFSVLQYNILADYLADNGSPWFLLPLDLNQTFRDQLLKKFYTKVEGRYAYNLRKNCFGELLPSADCEKVKEFQHLFDWSRRQPMLVKELKTLDADIFSLVELDHYEDFAIEFKDYESIFAKRPRRRSYDGSGLFWRRDRFEKVGEPIHEFFKDRDADQYEDPEYKFSHDRVMTAIALREKKTQQVLIVVSLHLMKNPENEKNDAVRIIEASQVMHHAVCLKDEHDAMGIIILGDFNAFPGSYTHVFMLHGWQSCHKPDFQIQDVYSRTRRQDADACTSRTMARKLWLDYIFYSNRTLRLFDTPFIEGCPAEPMPSERHPSDHLPLKATLQFREGATVPVRPDQWHFR